MKSDRSRGGHGDSFSGVEGDPGVGERVRSGGRGGGPR